MAGARLHGSVLGVLTSAAAVLASAPAAAAKGPRIGLEVDPLPFFHHGYSVHAEFKPAPRFRLSFGHFGYRFDGSGENDGFSVRIDAFEGSLGFFLLGPKDRGLFASLYVFEQRFRYRRDGVSAEARRHWLTPALAAGYQFLPWDQGPYLTAWAAFGVPVARTGETEVGDKSYHEPSIYPVLALHLGGELELP